MDTVGPSQVRSVGGKWYVLVIVDDYSRYSWVSKGDEKPSGQYLSLICDE
jgi:hypothetical protein